jgi:hypothetical protein
MIRRALHTQILRSDETIPLSRGVYIYGSFEERTKHFEGPIYENVTFVRIEESDDGDSFKINDQTECHQKQVLNFHQLLSIYAHQHVFLDITGLSHSIWAPMLKCMLEQKISFSIIYVEPFDYTKSFSMESGQIYDLSVKIRGISPIPGYVRFIDEDETFLFVPMVGFEGARFSYMIENVQPPGSNTFPIIGVPGFRAEYPFYTYQANKIPLKQTGSWKNVIYAAADCPFSAFLELENLSNKNHGLGLKIALIGTKPHALGAIMFCLAYPDRAEILYDHPIRNQKRTAGILKKHIFDINGFLQASDKGFSLMPNHRLR